MSREARARSDDGPILTVSNVTKRFGAIYALQDASFNATPGRIHALAGENGAGKSTLLKVLAGQYQNDEGTITLNSEPYRPASIFESRSHGVGIVFQETMLQPRLSIAENLLSGSYSEFLRGGFISWRRVREYADERLAQVGLEVDVTAPAESLKLGEQRLVELAAAIAHDPQLLLIDEITASLDANEVERFFEVVRGLADAGTAVVTVSHHLDEIFKLCDEVTVLRDGVTVATGVTADFDEASLTSAMVGRHLVEQQFGKELEPDLTQPPLLEISGAEVAGEFAELDLTLHQGDIVGITGLQGSGSEPVLDALFGLKRLDRGTVTFNGEPYAPASPIDAVEAGVAFVPKHRDSEGAIGSFSLRENAALPILRRLMRAGFVDRAEERRITQEFIDAVGTRPNDADLPCDALSGGNRQKVVIAKWLATRPRLLLLNSPTRGVDVGAKQEIYQLLSALAREGLSMVVVSEDLPELLTISRRIVVFNRGRVNAVFEPGQEWTRDAILEKML